MFDYTLPSYQNHILPMYPDSNWFISNKTIELIDVMFSSTRNRYRTYYTDSLNHLAIDKRRVVKRNMAQAAVRVLRFYLDHPQQFGNDPKNIHEYLFFISWKFFVATAKHVNKPSKYMPVSQSMIEHYGDLYLDKLMDEIENPITSTKKPRKYNVKKKDFNGYSKKQLDYLSNL